MSKKVTHWGILGLGKIAKKFAEGLQEVSGARLYAVASRSQQKAQEFSTSFKAEKAFGSYKEMLEDPGLEVVYIATPHSYHYQHTLLCLEHGKAVLCEKPFAMNRAQVEEMIAKAKAKNLFLMEALWTQFLPHFKEVKKMTNNGNYGKLQHIEADFGFHSDFDAEGRLFKKSLGGGSLLDIGIYPIFLALELLGIPQTIHAQAKFSKTGVDEECSIQFSYPNGASAKLKSSIIEKTPSTATLTFEEAVVTLHSRFHEPTNITIKTPNNVKNIEDDVKANGYNFEAAHVQKMLAKDRIESDTMSFERSLQLMELLDKVRAKIGLEYRM